MRSIPHVCRDGELSLASDLHALDTDVPSLDHLALAKLELEGFSLEALVELFPRLGQRSLVVHTHVFAGLGLGAIANPDVLGHDPALQGPLLGLGSLGWRRILLT